MIFEPTEIAGVVAVEVDRFADERGFFARTFCADEFAAHGLAQDLVQSSVSRNPKRGTLRGLHFQAEPASEPKLVRCTRGAIFDVAVDLRDGSPTYRRWAARELSADNHRALHIPGGCAHGFVTLEDDCEVLYCMGTRYVPDLARGVRWDDPAFGIEWPLAPTHISERDAGYPDFGT